MRFVGTPNILIVLRKKFVTMTWWKWVLEHVLTEGDWNCFLYFFLPLWQILFHIYSSKSLSGESLCVLQSCCSVATHWCEVLVAVLSAKPKVCGFRLGWEWPWSCPPELDSLEVFDAAGERGHLVCTSGGTVLLVWGGAATAREFLFMHLPHSCLTSAVRQS